MNLSSRTVKIRISPNVIGDSERILQEIASTFQGDDLDISITEENEISPQVENTNIHIDGNEVSVVLNIAADQGLSGKAKGIEVFQTPKDQNETQVEEQEDQQLTTEVIKDLKVSDDFEGQDRKERLVGKLGEALSEFQELEEPKRIDEEQDQLVEEKLAEMLKRAFSVAIPMVNSGLPAAARLFDGNIFLQAEKNLNRHG
ncbi:MAG: hypothetical protein F6K00_24720 [Leptolyngbya sp. SIOISBB]|nr:hypothetical protein [Leptolyngbya sp. SIOISBB]